MQWYKKKAVANVANLAEYQQMWEAYGNGVPFEQWMTANYPQVNMGQPTPAEPTQAPTAAAEPWVPTQPKKPGVELVHAPAKNLEPVKMRPGHHQDIQDSLKKMR